jgi:hypothetical protein
VSVAVNGAEETGDNPMKSDGMTIDGFTLTGAQNRFGRALNLYDDHFGSLYIYQDASGLSAIVRAGSEEDAYGIVEDEFLTEAPTWEEMAAWCDFVAPVVDGAPDYSALTEDASWSEQFGFRPNGPNVRDRVNHGVYARDLNGDRLTLATPEMLAELEWTLQLTCDECDAALETDASGAVPAHSHETER